MSARRKLSRRLRTVLRQERFRGLGRSGSAGSEKIITGVLRNELGYHGIIITDAMNMGAITEYYKSDVAAIMALKAGADMVLMPENFEEAYQGVLDAVVDGTVSEERINDSLRRIYRVKLKSRVL